MTGWIVLGIYCAGYVLTARKAAPWLVRIMCTDSLPVEATDRLFGRVLGCLVALLWPLVILGALITGKLPKTDQEIREELAAREQRISDLERENERLRRAQERF